VDADYDLGYFDLETHVLEVLDNPFGPSLLPMWPVRCVTTHVSGPESSNPVLETGGRHVQLGTKVPW
jgi:hypothetical protein